MAFVAMANLYSFLSVLNKLYTLGLNLILSLSSFFVIFFLREIIFFKFLFFIFN
jgi:hypothetical protein